MGLQFPWIEANLLGFFLVDVRNSRGKFDEIKEKFVINPAPIASQSSLNAGGTRWTRDLPRNSLNFFTSRSKVEEQRREYMLLKREIGPRIMGNWRIRGGGFQASWRRFLVHGFVASNPRGKSFNFASKRGMNFGAIGPRSGHDRAAIGP